MDSDFKSQEIENIFKPLSEEESFYVLGLSLVANDLMLNHDSLCHYPEDENIYFFASSISIIRELAKLLVAVKKSSLISLFSDNTMQLFEALKSELEPFDEDSLTKSVLKPVRDLTFHYNFSKSEESQVLKSSLIELKNKDGILMRFSNNQKSPIGQRYAFATSFRAAVTNSFLSSEIVSKISNVAVNSGCFVDSLLNDLVLKFRVGSNA
ncbi:MAG: hypothetical protein ABIJ59_18010 [Pseudomonadota bacterium]